MNLSWTTWYPVLHFLFPAKNNWSWTTWYPVNFYILCLLIRTNLPIGLNPIINDQNVSHRLIIYYLLIFINDNFVSFQQTKSKTGSTICARGLSRWSVTVRKVGKVRNTWLLGNGGCGIPSNSWGITSLHPQEESAPWNVKQGLPSRYFFYFINFFIS